MPAYPLTLKRRNLTKKNVKNEEKNASLSLFIRSCLYREVMPSSLNQEVLISQDSTLNSFTNKQTPVVEILFLQIVK